MTSQSEKSLPEDKGLKYTGPWMSSSVALESLRLQVFPTGSFLLFIVNQATQKNLRNSRLAKNDDDSIY